MEIYTYIHVIIAYTRYYYNMATSAYCWVLWPDQIVKLIATGVHAMQFIML